ncbi:hypothetical protein [Aeromicrobium yanjiei]|uniref:Uncharacterized protein n=1 Tax=Aeromicrobium yanjiei TaxID=2662028 RepID=A0A5Q2MDH8_9ACTN|nr:hypothetical protein [Aeromicrobium yanjiei]QGG39913.1 hypothetical protein GEV26_00155 [Aeromicrobium yanjiei]
MSGCTSGDSDSDNPRTGATPPPASPVATWDQQSHTAAELAANKLLMTWSRPTMAYEQWWAELKPLLSPEGQQKYAYTDPINIPKLKITGAGVESNNDNPHVVTITFPTTGGKFGVDLSRTSIPGRWVAENIIFPGDYSRLQ